MTNGRPLNLATLLLLSLATLAATRCGTAWAWPGGSGTCFADPEPIRKGMGGPVSTGNGGFAITLSNNATFYQGQKLTVTIKPLDADTATFKGLLLYAERPSDGLRLGRFLTPDLEKFGPMKERYNCNKNGADIASTICHKNRDDKQAPQSFEWVAPDFNITEPVYFRAVVVTTNYTNWHILEPVTAAFHHRDGPHPDPKPDPNPEPNSRGSDGKDEDSKFPVWGYILIATGAVALVGVIVGVIIRRASRKKQDPLLGDAQ